MPAPVTSRRIRSAARPAPRAPDLDAITLDVDAILAARANRRGLRLAQHIITDELRLVHAVIFAQCLAIPLALMLAVHP